MSEILGIGVTHHPGLMGIEENLAGLLKHTLKSPRVPEHLKDSSNWPEPMQAEWGDDAGVASARRHRTELMADFSRLRQRIEAFDPDFMVIWGDDQYEQFREECVPPFNVFAFDSVESQPYLVESDANPGAQNYWGDPVTKVFRTRGHAAGGKYLAHRLLESGFDMSYSYRLRKGQPLSHSFLNTMAFFDDDRKGFDVPIVPFHVNCYGNTIIRSRGGIAHLTDNADAALDPISPAPERCFALGRAVARLLRESPWRVVLVASSSWSHAFLCEKHWWLWPDVQADRTLFAALRDAQYERFRDLTLPQIEESGQQELLNWVCLAGALHELGYRAEYINYYESYIFNSNKCMASFTAAGRQP
jgi:hypothetical protein